LGDTLSQFLLNFALEYAGRNVLESQEVLKLNRTHQLLLCSDDVHLLDEYINAVKKIIEAVLQASREVGLEVNAENTKYMVIYRHQNLEIVIFFLLTNPLKMWQI
jgi:uncharacterized protein (DUF1778 family)